jgi:hypothetical protein
VLVAASEGHFARRGRIYRHSPDGGSTPRAVLDGLPEWTDGIVDTHCIDVSSSSIAFADKSGSIYVSQDEGLRWSSWSHALPPVSSLLVL